MKPTEIILPDAIIGKIVKDEDTGQEVMITDQLKNEAVACHARLEMGVFITAMSLKEMRDKKLYLVFGHQSFKQYCENELPFNRAGAYRFLSIADNLLTLNTVDENQVVSNMRQLEGMNQGKLISLSKLSHDQRSRLMAEGILELGDTELSLDEMKGMLSAELEKKLKAYAPKIAEIPEMEQEIKERKASEKTLRRQLEKMDEEIKKLTKDQGTGHVAKLKRSISWMWGEIAHDSKKILKHEEATPGDLADLKELFEKFVADASIFLEEHESEL